MLAELRLPVGAGAVAARPVALLRRGPHQPGGHAFRVDQAGGLIGRFGRVFSEQSPDRPVPTPFRKNAAKAANPAPRLVNPESVAARLMRATPEQRERALQLFPPDRQAQLRKQLAWFDSLPKAQQEIQLRRLNDSPACRPTSSYWFASRCKTSTACLRRETARSGRRWLCCKVCRPLSALSA